MKEFICNLPYRTGCGEDNLSFEASRSLENPATEIVIYLSSVKPIPANEILKR